MVATVRCEEIANEKLRHLTSNEGLLELEAAVQSGPVSGFGKKLGVILDTCLSAYDSETIYFDEGVRRTKRQQLESRALQLVYPAFQTMLGHLRYKALEKFKYDVEQSLKSGKGFAVSVRECTTSSMLEFDRDFEDVSIKQANWDATKIREKLRRDIEAYSESVRGAMLSKLKADFEKQLSKALAEPIQSLLNSGAQDTWTSIRKLYKRETDNSISEFSTSLSGFELDQAALDSMRTEMRNYSRSVVERKAREEAGKVLILMKDRFSTVFSHDKDYLPRVWTGKEDIKAITKEARAEALKLLSGLAAIRLDEKADKIEDILISTLLDKSVSKTRSIEASTDPLSSSTWEEVDPNDVLISPVQCKLIWRQFTVETEYTVTQAISAQETYRRNNSWLPPPWALAAIAILGFNEFMMLLRNPLYLMVLFVIYLVSKAIWVQLDITREFHHGTLSGLLALSSRLLPTIMNLLKKLADQGQRPDQDPPLSSQSFRSQSKAQSSVSSSVPDSLSSSTLSSFNRSDVEDMDQEFISS